MFAVTTAPSTSAWMRHGGRPACLSAGVSLTPAPPPEETGPQLGPPSLQFVHFAELGSAWLSWCHSPNNHHLFEKTVSVVTQKRSHKALNHHCPLLPYSVASALCFPFQRPFRIRFCALGPIQQLPLPAKPKPAVTFSPTQCLPGTGWH